MKNLLACLICFAAVGFYSCSDDDGDNKTKCMKCTSSDPSITFEDGEDEACEGDKDEDGNTVSLSDLEAAKAFFDQIDGVSCSID